MNNRNFKDYNEHLISNENNYNNDFSDTLKNNNNNYSNNSNNYNYNNNNNINNNYNNNNNNNYNNNNISSPISNNNVNFEIILSDNFEINCSKVPTKDNKLEKEKFCCCCYTKDLLIELDCDKKIDFIMLFFVYLLFIIIVIFYTLNDTYIFRIMNFIHCFYGILCLLSFIRNKYIRYSVCVFSIIFLPVGILGIILKGIILCKNKDKTDDIKYFIIFLLECMKGTCFLSLEGLIFFTYFNTCCEVCNSYGIDRRKVWKKIGDFHHNY